MTRKRYVRPEAAWFAPESDDHVPMRYDERSQLAPTLVSVFCHFFHLARYAVAIIHDVKSITPR